MSLPTVAFTGEQFPVDLNISSPSAVSGTVQISAEGKVLGSNPVTLEKGSNQIRVHASLTAAGALNLTGVIHADRPGRNSIRSRRHAAPSQGPVRLAGSRGHRGASAADSGRGSVRCRSHQRSRCTARSPIINWWSSTIWIWNRLPASRKDEIEKFVKQGGGLLVIAGERNVYADNKKVEDALDRTLPAKLAPPRSPEGTAVVLIIDKSSSMEGKKIELARLAAIGVVENLRPIDQVGVLIFDNSFQWAVPMRHAEDKVADQAADFRHRSRRRHADRAGAGGSVSQSAALARHVQAHRAAHRRNFGRRRQSGSFEGSGGAARHHFHGRSRART